MTEAIYQSRIAALESEIAALYKAASDATRQNVELRQRLEAIGRQADHYLALVKLERELKKAREAILWN
jgi:predicted  nucleic acid-binding Zn-ribbon protein